MKRLYLSILFCAGVAFCNGQRYSYYGPEKLQRRSIIKTNPFTMLVGNIPLTGEYRLSYEFPTGPKESMQIGVSYIGKSILWNSILSSDSLSNWVYPAFSISGFRFQAMEKFFLVRKKAQPPKGFYFGPHFSYSVVYFTFKSNTQDYVLVSYLNANLLFGYQFVIKRFVIDVFTGLGYKWNSVKVHALYTQGKQFDQEISNDQRVKPSLGVNFGYTF